MDRMNISYMARFIYPSDSTVSNNDNTQSNNDLNHKHLIS